MIRVRASFTNRLHQRKPSFGVKIVLSGFTKHPKRWKGMDTVIFEPDIIEYAFVGVYLSDVKVMGGDYSNESRKAFY